MKCILLYCFCIIIYINASAQTDSTTIKDSVTSLPIQKNAIKDMPKFSYHMLMSYRLPDNGNRLYFLPQYQNIYRPVTMKNKLKTVFEVVGYTFLSAVADYNHYNYSYIPRR